jgi:hypothetical protein
MLHHWPRDTDLCCRNVHIHYGSISHLNGVDKLRKTEIRDQKNRDKIHEMTMRLESVVHVGLGH